MPKPQNNANKPSRRRPRAAAASDSGSSTTADVRNLPLPVLHKRALENGRFSCANIAHFTLTNEGHCRMKPYADILASMLPEKDAVCECEREACRFAWTYNRPGQLETEFVIPGLYRKGCGKVDGVPKLVEPVNYCLRDDQLKLLRDLYPTRKFITVGDQDHDHPVSHISSAINARRMWDLIPDNGDEIHVVDLNGNPGANLALMSRKKHLVIHTICHVVTPKDQIRRHQKWGPEIAADGTRRWYDCYIRKTDLAKLDIPWHKVKYFMAMHTVYYYSEDEIADLLDLSPGSIMYASLHRHKGISGEFYGGEHEWEVVRDEYLETGTNMLQRVSREQIKQTNTITGEFYTHLATEKWFTHSSLLVNHAPVEATTTRALAWTTNILNRFVMLLTITRVNKFVAVSSSGCRSSDPDTVFTRNDMLPVKMVTADDICSQHTYTIGEVVFEVPRRHRDYLNEIMALSIKPYSEQAFTSFSNLCILKAKQPKHNGMTPQDRDTMIHIAYWCNYERKVNLQNQLVSGNKNIVRASHAPVLTKKLLKQTAQVLAMGLRSGPSTVIATALEKAADYTDAV